MAKPLKNTNIKSIGRPFVPGVSGNPKGKPKGAKNKVTQTVKEMILGALDELGGQAWLVQQAGKYPEAFMRLLGQVMPRQVAAAVVVDFGDLTKKTDKELQSLILSVPDEQE